jgi:glycosyltransferase involved in cell wall biosynthesis
VPRRKREIPRRVESSDLRIAVWHNLPSGGGKRALYYHVRGLANRGHTVQCWRLSTADSTYLPLSDLTLERVIQYDFEASSIRRLTSKLTRSYYLAIERMRAFDEACQQCAREINAGDFDLLFANSATSFYVPYVMRHVRLPKLLYLQEPHRPSYEALPILPWVEGVTEDLRRANLFSLFGVTIDYPRLQSLRVQARQEWLNVRAADSVLVNSYYSRESVLRAYGIEAQVCYLGIDTSLFQPLRVPRKRFIVGLGSFDSVKGVDKAVRAIGLLPAPRPPLVWISNSGNAHYQREMEKLANTLEVDLRIHRAISDTELVAILNEAALLVYTSRLEPFGFAPLEANACGTPVVAVAEGGVRETVVDGLNGFLVDPDPESIRAAIHRLLEDPDAARQMGENGVKYVREKWAVDSSIDRLEEQMNRVTSRNSTTNRQAPDCETEMRGVA